MPTPITRLAGVLPAEQRTGSADAPRVSTASPKPASGNPNPDRKPRRSHPEPKTSYNKPTGDTASEPLSHTTSLDMTTRGATHEIVVFCPFTTVPPMRSPAYG